mmetsp:Transcript_65938/g.133953  ORF Transcript_65938/g.133953 Transcript_65938/m.133953 type:complete len:398 (-) Transcript_65938:38-1231(-)
MASIVSVPRGAASPQRQPLERLLDRRMQSVSTFVSSAASVGFTGQTARETRLSTWPEMMPEAILFPANKPSSRADAEVLDRWVSTSFQSYARRQRLDSKENLEEDLSKTVQELVPILSIGLNEVVRQVSQHCLERGVVLEKIWRTYVELFEESLSEAREALRRQKEKTAKCEAELQRIRDEATELKAKHPAQLEKLKQTLTTKFDQRQNELVQQLTNARSENRALKIHLEEQTAKQSAWFPLFSMYKDSKFRRALLGKAGADLPKNATVEARLGADFRRILSSLPPDVRRRIGFFVSSLLGFRGVGLSAVTAEALQERKQLNAKKIEQLKARLRELQGEESSEEESEDMALPSQKVADLKAKMAIMRGGEVPQIPKTPSDENPENEEELGEDLSDQG